jgi:hypothetical protein
LFPAPEREDWPINIPLNEMDRETIAQLGRGAPVIVYCHDYQ